MAPTHGGMKSVLTKPKINMINFMVVCINEFAHRFSLNTKEAFDYLYQYKGIEFIKDHYEVEHCLSLDDTIDDITLVCKNNGGFLA